MKKLLILLSGSFLFANSIVIYNNNLSFINENKNIKKKQNNPYFYVNNLSFDIIDSSINIDSKELKIDSFELLKPLSYDKKLLKLNLNKSVDFILNKNIKNGILVQIEPKIIIKSDDKYYLIENINNIIFQNIPYKYKNKAYLKVKINKNTTNKFHINLKYLLKNLSWSSSYILNINRDTLTLKAFINLQNRSSKSFNNYNISFVAGKLNRVNRYENDRVYLRSPVHMMAKSFSVNIDSKKIDSYYIYKLPHKDSIRENSSKNFLLFVAKNIKYKSYYEANSHFLRNGEEKLDFSKIIEFKNSKENNLDIPLPSGVVRIYSKNIYLGEDYIKNRAKEANIKIKTGVEFDLSAKKRVIEYKKNKNYQKYTIEYNIKNSSSKDKLLKIKESIPNYNLHSQIDFNSSCANNCKIKKITAFLREYDIKLKANSKYIFKSRYEIYK